MESEKKMSGVVAVLCALMVSASIPGRATAGRRGEKSAAEKAVASGEAYPTFDLNYWDTAAVKARGKIMRGAVLGVTGLAIAAPTAILSIKAADNPEQYLVYAGVVGIAALGATLHGFFSIGLGANQRARANAFVSQYRADPTSVDKEAERRIYLSDAKKSAGKMVLFGMVLDVQGALLLANGIVLSVRDSRGELRSGVKIWPSYLIGSLLLAGGTTFAILRGRTFLSLSKLGRTAAAAPNASVAPLITVDPADGNPVFGLQAGLSF